MAFIIAEFFQIIGVDISTPSTMAELIPYLLTVFIGICLVSAVFFVLGKLMEILLNFTRWK